ncbi:MAG: hypothetical protein LBH24_04100, partial [Clostridiales bacterium]|jgi:hypothetical protein|nr:hypothetical protein [Clostridiales bacterium]
VTLPSGLERFKLGLKAALKKLLSGAGLTVKLLGIVCFKAIRLLFIGLKKAIRLLFIGAKKGGQAAGRALKRPFTKKAAATPEPPPAETTE